MGETNFLNITGQISHIGDIEQIQRSDNADFFKRLLTISLPDGQVFYAELRNNLIKQLEIQNIRVEDIVNLNISFQGSEKNGKRYNNLYIARIVKI